MPLARIDLRAGKTAQYRTAIGNAVYDAMIAVGVPLNDRFQVITEHDAVGFVFDPNYLDIKRSDDLVIIQVTWNEGRTTDQKKAFYKAVVSNLVQSPGLRPEDVFINLIEVKRENWSFGLGEAQYGV